MALPMLRIAHYVVTAESDPISWIEAPSAVSLASRIKDLTGGSEQVLVHAPLVAVGIYLSVRAARSAGAGSSSSWRPLVPVSWLVLPIVFTAATTYLAKPLFEVKYLIVVVPALILLLAVGVVSLPTRRWRTLAAVAVVATSLVGVVQVHRTEGPEDWDGAVAAVLDDAQPGDALVAAQFPAGDAIEYHVDQAGRADVAVTDPVVGADPVHDRLWEVAQLDIDPTLDLPSWSPRRGYTDWLDQHYEVVEERRFTGLAVRLLERRR
jgi:hypothetical protein